MISGLFSLPLASADAADVAVRNRAAPVPATTRFVAGPENALVRVAGQAVDGELLAYNPIVLYGPAGVGKSTLGPCAGRRAPASGLA